MSIDIKVRKLARSAYWQRIYLSSQKNQGIHLFENINNFSGVQVLFLYWLTVYSMLYEELSSKEWLNLDEKVIEDDFRCDAFLYWRSKDIEKKQEEYKKDIRQTEKKGTSLNKNAGKQSLNIYKGAKGNKK
jgi:hypothetical protein